MDRKTIAIIGAGYMAKEYYKVLRDMECQTIVLGRGEQKAKQFEEEFGVKVYTGDYREVLCRQPAMPEYAIVAVNVGALCSVTQELMQLGIRNILIEKPVAYATADLVKLLEVQKKTKVNIYVAYNRRFFASVTKAREMIRADGGVTSFQFEFTEWASVVGATKRPKGEKEGWIFANSTHGSRIFPRRLSNGNEILYRRRPGLASERQQVCRGWHIRKRRFIFLSGKLGSARKMGCRGAYCQATLLPKAHGNTAGTESRLRYGRASRIRGLPGEEI